MDTNTSSVGVGTAGGTCFAGGDIFLVAVSSCRSEAFLFLSVSCFGGLVGMGAVGRSIVAPIVVGDSGNTVFLEILGVLTGRGGLSCDVVATLVEISSHEGSMLGCGPLGLLTTPSTLLGGEAIFLNGEPVSTSSGRLRETRKLLGLASGESGSSLTVGSGSLT